MAKRKAKKETHKKDFSGSRVEPKPSLNKNPQPEPDRSGDQFRKGGWVGWACLAGVIMAAFLGNFHTLTDTDIFWHLKTGQIIWQTHQVPHQDLFSFTVAGKEWIDAQWLFQAMIYALYRVSGYAGMILLGAVLTGLIWALMLGPAFSPRKYFWVILLALVALITASVRMKLRPEIFSYFFMTAEILLINRYQRGKKSALYPLPLLLLLWVNSEGLWPIYFLILGAFLLEEIFFLPQLKFGRYVQRGFPVPAKSAAVGLLICLILSLPLALLNPNGFKGALFPWTLLKEVSLPGNLTGNWIDEFRSPFAMLTRFSLTAYVILIAGSALVFGLLLFKRIFYPAAFLLEAAFLGLSLSAVRNVAPFAILTGALLGRILKESPYETIFPWPKIRDRLFRLRPPAVGLVLATMILLSADMVTSRYYALIGQTYRFGIGALETDYPIRAAETLKAVCAASGEKVHLKIFADLFNAGYLIWAGYPEWKVYFDPRLEVYGEEMLKTQVQAITDWPSFKAEDRKYDFSAVVIVPGSTLKNLIVSLGRDPDWSLVHLDGMSVVFVKNQAALEPGIRAYGIDFEKGFASIPPRGLNGRWLAGEKLRVGATIMYLGHPGPALSELEQGLSLAPEDFGLNYYTGLALNSLQRYPEALPHLEKAARLEPEDIPNLNEQAWAYFSTGRTGEAIEIYRRILAKHPREITTCMNLALVYELSKSELAYPQWQTCGELTKSDPYAYEQFYPEIEQALSRLKR